MGPNNGVFSVFQEDYETVLNSFRKILPEFETKSHIVRYLATHQILGHEFLYSVMLDLKELEKHVLLRCHIDTTREDFLKEQLNELLKYNELYQKENNELRAQLERIMEAQSNRTSRREDEGSEARNSLYMKKHYQGLLQKLNEFYGQKMDVLRQSLLSVEKHSATKMAVEGIFEDLVEEISSEGLQKTFKENIKKIQEVHSLIGELWQEKNKECVDYERIERKSTRLKTGDTRKETSDYSSIDPLTTRRFELLELRHTENRIEESSMSIYEQREGPETRLNTSEIENLSIECLLNEKDQEMEIVRKKEMMYQNMIYSLAQELKGVKNNNYEIQRLELYERENDLGKGCSFIVS